MSTTTIIATTLGPVALCHLTEDRAVFSWGNEQYDPEGAKVPLDENGVPCRGRVDFGKVSWRGNDPAWRYDFSTIYRTDKHYAPVTDNAKNKIIAALLEVLETDKIAPADTARHALAVAESDHDRSLRKLTEARQALAEAQAEVKVTGSALSDARWDLDHIDAPKEAS